MKKKKIIKKTVTLVLTLLWMSMIFSFSHQNGVQSAGLSQQVAYWLADTADQVFHLDNTREELQQQADQMQFVIRKGAHMTEYAVLSCLLLLHLGCYEKISHRYVIVWILCLLFAAADELHQRFIPGRAGQAVDVCIDSVGSMLGIAAAAVGITLWRKHKNKG